MSGVCPKCGNNRSVHENCDGTYYCTDCEIYLELKQVEGGCILSEITDTFEPCPICGKRLNWENVDYIDSEGYETTSDEQCERLLLSCDCGFCMVVDALSVEFPFADWDDNTDRSWQNNFLEVVNKRDKKLKPPTAYVDCPFCDKGALRIVDTQRIVFPIPKPQQNGWKRTYKCTNCSCSAITTERE